MFVFFFFKQKTAYEMRISDWSSDVCSSDLITVDSDTSTSDTVLAFATGKAGNAPLSSVDDEGADAFHAALSDVCRQLAHLVVRDGEGASKFIEVKVAGAGTDESARKIALSERKSTHVNSSHKFAARKTFF